ncbi:MAG: hypothetical protein HY286_17405 [Planctomycetes bacterium]|nr:hypothetical protein [Planctomycetota bacterium]
MSNNNKKQRANPPMTPAQAIAFVVSHGVVLESGAGPVPSLAETIAGGAIRGSWWSHREAKNIFLCTRAVREDADMLVCKLVGGKITYVHRRLWSALVRLADQIDEDRLHSIGEVHTKTGKHKITLNAFPNWVPEAVRREAAMMKASDAAALLPFAINTNTRITKQKHRPSGRID